MLCDLASYLLRSSFAGGEGSQNVPYISSLPIPSPHSPFLISGLPSLSWANQETQNSSLVIMQNIPLIPLMRRMALGDCCARPCSKHGEVVVGKTDVAPGLHGTIIPCGETINQTSPVRSGGMRLRGNKVREKEWGLWALLWRCGLRGCPPQKRGIWAETRVMSLPGRTSAVMGISLTQLPDLGEKGEHREEKAL